MGQRQKKFKKVKNPFKSVQSVSSVFLSINMGVEEKKLIALLNLIWVSNLILLKINQLRINPRPRLL